MNLKQLDYRRLKKVFDALGYQFYDAGDYNMNIIGIRTDDQRSNLFNDWICLAFRQNDHEQLMVFDATTDPGTYWRKHPMNINGTAILKPGQYAGSHRTGLHQGNYLALVQDSPMTVYRDNNGDDKLDTGSDIAIESGHFGINIHRASAHGITENVGRWSAGCQVISRNVDFNLFMALITRAATEWGNRFSYTLLTEPQLWNA